jgi:hypothetical protein
MIKIRGFDTLGLGAGRIRTSLKEIVLSVSVAVSLSPCLCHRFSVTVSLSPLCSLI